MEGQQEFEGAGHIASSIRKWGDMNAGGGGGGLLFSFSRSPENQPKEW